jgi:hypothetical protein
MQQRPRAARIASGIPNGSQTGARFYQITENAPRIAHSGTAPQTLPYTLAAQYLPLCANLGGINATGCAPIRMNRRLWGEKRGATQ